ncbi:HlyD family efflux transporter periplasmic adaptor subunit [Pedobacter sp. R-06]|uniref:HlyD family efflux transporter periplasmic adaptor subunit n=1 Tax=Pedobacter sp. R-06 TaxID=3404051 RepID=UPI003CF32488
MPNEIFYQEVNSEEVQEIITAVPSWILSWGITMVFTLLAGIVLLSALIEYPDVVKTNLKVNSLNAPKQVLAKQSGKITTLLVKDGDGVSENQSLGFLESTGDHNDVLLLNAVLKKLQKDILNPQLNSSLPKNLNLGELQSSYQSFYQQYLQYQSTQKNGYYLNKVAYLEKDLKSIDALKSQIIQQKKVQKLEYANQEQEYSAYQKLYKNKVISRSEFVQQENKYLASKYPLQQTETSILNNTSSYSAKEKELLDLKHTITEEQAKFMQALNRCVNESDHWIQQYILKSPINGKVSYAGIIQQNQNVIANQEVFIVNPGNTNFFGEIQIPQYNMGKIHVGERTLVKLRSYPYEQYGMISGRLTYISDVAYRDSVFVAKVSFEYFENKHPLRKVILKIGMQADAEIITEESSLLQRFFRNMIRILNSN